MVFMTVAPQFHSIRFPRLIHNALCIVLKHMFAKGTEGWLPHRISFVRKKAPQGTYAHTDCSQIGADRQLC